jgi:ankyrin repeat protein
MCQHVAAHNGAVESARLLIEAGADVNHNKDHAMGYSPLHWAADQGQLKSALVLLMSAANPDGENCAQRLMHSSCTILPICARETSNRQAGELTNTRPKLPQWRVLAASDRCTLPQRRAMTYSARRC